MTQSEVVEGTVMSLARMIFLSALLAGWGAYFGWLVCEFLVLRGAGGGAGAAVAVAAVVGGAIGAAVGGTAGLSEGAWGQAAARAVYGFLGGLVGGLLGGLAGQGLYSAGLPRAVGWALMGLGIGATDGLIQKSARKARNGLIGGALGGLVGGLLFDPISSALAAGTGMASRAAGFVIMGLSIGVLIGIVQVVLRDAWVTVVDGFRTGRQLILTRPVTTLGRSELAHLPFLGSLGKSLEMEHARIERRPDGRFVLVDNDTREGTRVNNEPVTAPVVLHDGDVIRIGPNYIRFNEQARKQRYEAPRTARRPRSAEPAEAPDWIDEPAPATPESAPAPPPQTRAPLPPDPVPMADPVSVAKPGPASTPTRTPPTAKPPNPKPSATAPPVAKPPPPPAPKPATPPRPVDPDACPYCRNGTKHPGARGGRYCMVHDQMY